jgi:hypothetical protein
MWTATFASWQLKKAPHFPKFIPTQRLAKTNDAITECIGLNTQGICERNTNLNMRNAP